MLWPLTIILKSILEKKAKPSRDQKVKLNIKRSMNDYSDYKDNFLMV